MNHKLGKHTDENFGYNMADVQSKNNMFFNFVAEQNIEVIEEYRKFKSEMKQVVERLINNFEDTVKDLKDEIMKQKVDTTKAINELQHVVKTKPAIKPQAKSKAERISPSAAKNSSPQAPPPNNEKKSSGTSNRAKPPQSKSRSKTVYQRKPRTLYVGDSIANNTNFRKLEHVTNTTIKSAKAYSSAWDKDARFKKLNVTDIVRNEIKNDEFDHLVLAAPTVDISNIDTSKVQATDDTEFLKQKAGNSCQIMMKVL